MAGPDSISVFAEGTFEEQVQELVDYIARTRPETEQAEFKRPFADSLKTSEGQKPIAEDEERKRNVISQVVGSVDGLGEGSDREIEGFFNLLFSYLIDVYTLDSQSLSRDVSRILDVISNQSAKEHVSIKYRILANLFNAIPRTSPVRLVVCKTLLRLAVENDELDNLRLRTTDVDRWLNEWNASAEEKCEFLKNVADAFASAGQLETAFAFSISHVRSLPPSESTRPSLQLIALALRIPTVFDFDPVLKLESVQTLNGSQLYGLLNIFNKGSLGEFNSWKEKNQSTVNEYQLDVDQLEKKLRLLVLSELGFAKIGQNIPYSEIASSLQVETSEVEKWAIDVIRSGLLSGKLAQTTQTLHVVRASPRGFAIEQWAELEKRLLTWKEGLAGIQNVLSATRQSISSAVVPEQAA
ncbi:PCI-domain-containing protein [Fomitiporia mediterranea MF3/22]|uniref:PCI-domain-containing protein n=1 Tax=Fomitiporia mediterranea (strain MF3/22) TaxID=694068 RepID=UPI0004407F3E|nr:PCI-domain-containing protein [Fomitiporia mediterranea MF3/22]EJD01555.1 PCI-domain-containing protein [Fomitiporia mediterranea MF3/22]